MDSQSRGAVGKLRRQRTLLIGSDAPSGKGVKGWRYEKVNPQTKGPNRRC